MDAVNKKNLEFTGSRTPKSRSSNPRLVAKSTALSGLLTNNSIQFFIICVLSQQLQSQLQTEHSVDTSDHNCKTHNNNNNDNDINYSNYCNI
jgi:hypothetical protein